jgi:P-type conjugative transfer protein TrbL
MILYDPSTGAELMTQIINQYTAIFSGYYSQFLSWGSWLFYSFAAIAIVWLCLWCAFDSENAMTAMPEFLREFFIIAFFYTLMIHGAAWLSSIVNTAESMNQQLTHQPIDPASIIQQGLTVANKILTPVKNSAAANLGIGINFITLSYLITLGAFTGVALTFAVTLLTTTFLISLSGFFLAFGAFAWTREVARHTIDRVISYSIKLLSMYLVIHAGANIFSRLSAFLPSEQIVTFDVYAWTAATAMLFWLITHYLPKYMSEIFLFNTARKL